VSEPKDPEKKGGVAVAKCGNCDYPLICRECGVKFTFINEQVYEAFYDRNTPVICPNCQQILTCKYCGYKYDASIYEYHSNQ